MATSTAPVLSTPSEHILEGPGLADLPIPEDRLSDEQLYVQYEIQRTVLEIRNGRWKRIALQFPDAMLGDAPRVFERLQVELKTKGDQALSSQPKQHHTSNAIENSSLVTLDSHGDLVPEEAVEEKLTILADTSYGACCVDEVAAEHVEADVVVHYGRACLSPTARLPVIYVFTTKSLDLEAAVMSFRADFTDLDEKVCLMADLPYHHHLPSLSRRLRERGYRNVFQTEIIRDPSSMLPNRTVPANVTETAAVLNDYSVFHVSSPLTSLLLILYSRVKQIRIFETDQTDTNVDLAATVSQLMRRRYALVTSLSTVSIFGILINTLSVSNYMQALQHCQNLIRAAGKKNYVFVVGKVNAAKMANFSEIGGWVVIGCWESSLIESKDLYRPIITPFELKVALTEDKKRVWGAKWVSDFSQLLGRMQGGRKDDGTHIDDEVVEDADRDWDDQSSDDEPPEFDLRTGKYVSQSRPMGRVRPSKSTPKADTHVIAESAPSSSALVQRAKGDLTTINGTVSPAAEYLRSKRTWQGLGDDHEVAYERDEGGNIRGAAMEEGRSGVAKGYAVGDGQTRS